MIDDGDDKMKYFVEPTKFRIEVIGYKKEFIFDTQSSLLLRSWTNVLYANWNASKSFNLTNQAALFSSKFYKVISLIF